MSLLIQIDADLKQALLGRDTAATSTLRLLKSELLNAEKTTGTNLTEDAGIAVVRKEIKKRGDSAAMYAQAGQTDRAAAETQEATLMAKYLPPAADEAAVLAFATSQLASLPEGPAAKGQLIRAIKEQFGSTMDGATAARITDQVLATR